MTERVVFGMTSGRVDDEVLEEVRDALDEVAEDDWDLVSWRRSAGTRFIIYAPVRCRSIVEESGLRARIWPRGQLIEDMSDQRNEWLSPESSMTTSLLNKARSRVEKWLLRDMWSQVSEGQSEDTAETSREYDESRDQDSPDPGFHVGSVQSDDSNVRPISMVREKPSNKVLEIFGLSGSEKDSNGDQIPVFTLQEER